MVCLDRRWGIQTEKDQLWRRSCGPKEHSLSVRIDLRALILKSTLQGGSCPVPFLVPQGIIPDHRACSSPISR